LPPDHVDPNIHPTKRDVRLRFGHQVADTVKRAISVTLRNHAAARFGDSVTVSAAPESIDASLAHLQTLFERVPADDPSETGAQSGLRVLAQIDRTYILATDGSAIVLVDQHAAHERIAYERIVAAANAATAPAEPLLVPFAFELSGDRVAALERVLEPLREGGLEIENFGDRSYRIIATPAGYGARAFDVAGFLDDVNAGAKERDVRERVWASLACHSVTRAGDRLDLSEMTTLLDRLQVCENPMHCPHGRPTIVRIEPGGIARLFKR